MTAKTNQRWGGRNHTSVSRFVMSIVDYLNFFLVTFFKSNKYMTLSLCLASLPAVADALTKVTGKLVHK